MSKPVNHIITPGSATLSYDGQVKTFFSGSTEYDRIKSFVKDNDEDALIDLLLNFKKTIEDKYVGFKVVDDVVFVKGPDGIEDSLPRTLGDRLLEFAKEGLPYQPIINFWNRLQRNPSFSAVQRLFECIEHNHHPLNADGRFLAWKRVRADFKDFHSGKFDNSVGKLVSVPRNKVDEDMDKTCSNGLHVASYDYACNSYHSGEGLLIEVLVDPEHVVAIPRDYNNQKMRLCAYEVVQVCTEENKSNIYNYNAEDYDTDEDGDVCNSCGEEFDTCSCF